ncbi:hypothetical protein ATCC90586_000623 [Pythium insidiosum]|nr:hypothetical protein ATCC90586_000623 [Pythium insidiosum]
MQATRVDDAVANAAALESLQAQGANALAAFRPRMSLCPHCHEGFGSASLPIHVRRCRALLPDPEAEAKAAADALAATTLSCPAKKRQVPKLVDLCLAVFTRNFQGMCLDKVMAAPEHEVALIDALPTDLVHRIVANLVYDNKKMAAKADKERSNVRHLRKELEELQVQKGQLELFRQQSALYRSRLTEQDQVVEQLRRDHERVAHLVTALEHKNKQLQSQVDSWQRKRQRVDTRINALVAENDELKQQLRDAGRKEAELVKRLASAVREMASSLLPRSLAWMDDALHAEERQLAEKRSILTEVHHVLDEMVYDVETHARECEVARLRHDLGVARTTIAEYEERERTLIRERQEAYDFARQVEREGHELMERLQENLRVVTAELAKKDSLEKELMHAKEQLSLTSQLSKELANAQREIRELHRKNSIQKLLRMGATQSPRHQPRAGPTKSRSFIVESTAYSTRHLDDADVSPVPHDRHAISSNNQAESSSDQFDACPEKVLLNVFSYLDANSVFAMSLTSRSLMGRVHTLFGMPQPAILSNDNKRSSESSRRRTPTETPVSSAYARVRALKERSQSTAITPSEKEKAQLARAEQIVKSLKKDEIKLFHDMSTRVKALETHLAQVHAEKEDIAARLHSAESVRDFLMDKLKDLEDRLSNTIDSTAKKEEQAAMDREIIGFLDAKTQEYEITLQQYASQNDEIRLELARLKEESETKLTIVQDMVGLLTDEKQELEVQLRSQRKLLVREVKGLRAQNQLLAEEKATYLNQLKTLKHALQHLEHLS